MKWLVCIIMKNLPLGKSAESILRSYHPDAPDEHAACMDLEKVGQRCGKCGSVHDSVADDTKVLGVTVSVWENEGAITLLPPAIAPGCSDLSQQEPKTVPRTAIKPHSVAKVPSVLSSGLTFLLQSLFTRTCMN